MTHEPLVSVLTPSYDSARFIEETILSVLNQDYPHIEHIVVDGGSTDGTVDILRKYDGQIKWISEPDEGQSDALNKGLKQVQGEIVGWLNADDTYCNGTISAIVTFLLSKPHVGMVYGDCNFVDLDGSRLVVAKSQDFALKDLVLKDFIPQPTVFVRREILEHVGGWDVGLHLVMDYDLWLRIAMYSRLAHVRQVLANFRLHPGSKTSLQAVRFSEEELIVLERYFSSVELTSELLTRKDTAMAMAYLRGATHKYHAGLTESAKEDLVRAAELAPHLMNCHDELIGILIKPVQLAGDPERYIQTVFANLPSQLRQLAHLRRVTLGTIWASRIFMAYERGDLVAVRNMLPRVVLYSPKWLYNRGMISILIASLIGERAATQLRSVSRRLMRPNTG